MNPFGAMRPIAAIQPGNTASGKKLPPAINNGNTSIIETMLAVFWLLNSICSAPNQANKAMPDSAIQTSEDGSLANEIP